MFDYVEGRDFPARTCTLSLFNTLNTDSIDGLSISICYWIVLSELACFVMGYPAGALSRKNYVVTSLLNFGFNIALLLSMTPIMACYDKNVNSVGRNRLFFRMY